jgi:hypothetical protein
MVLEEDGGIMFIEDFLSIDIDKCHVFYTKDCLRVNDFTIQMSKKLPDEYLLVDPVWAPHNSYEKFFAKSIKVRDIVKRLGVNDVEFKTFSKYGSLLDRSFFSDLEQAEKYIIVLDCYAFLAKKLIIHNIGLSPVSIDRVSNHLSFLYEGGYRFVEFYYGGINTVPILANIPHKKMFFKIL